MAMITLPAPRAFDNTPASLLGSVPCLQCVSEKELLAALVGILATAQSKTGAEALSESACFKCVSRKEMLQMLVTMMGNELVGEAGLATVISEYKCLSCADEKTLLAAALYLWGRYLGLVTLTHD